MKSKPKDVYQSANSAYMKSLEFLDPESIKKPVIKPKAKKVAKKPVK